jgi:Uncharacterized protein conserved in bacteria (DUF2344)
VAVAPDPPETPPRNEPRQRWRIEFARDPVAADQVGRAALDGWQAALATSGLPLVVADSGDRRPRLTLAAALPAAARGEAELLEVWLTERRTLWQVREALAPVMPEAHRWVDAEDIWLGAPALPGLVAAADWRVAVEIRASAADQTQAGLGADSRVAGAARGLLAAASIPRTRAKGGAKKPYDLRPLLLDLRVDDGSPIALAIRTRIHPELGAGRPEEVVAALAAAAGLDLEIRSQTRTRLLLAEDLTRMPAWSG